MNELKNNLIILCHKNSFVKMNLITFSIIEELCGEIYVRTVAELHLDTEGP